MSEMKLRVLKGSDTPKEALYDSLDNMDVTENVFLIDLVAW